MALLTVTLLHAIISTAIGDFDVSTRVGPATFLVSLSLVSGANGIILKVKMIVVIYFSLICHSNQRSASSLIIFASYSLSRYYLFCQRAFATCYHDLILYSEENKRGSIEKSLLRNRKPHNYNTLVLTTSNGNSHLGKNFILLWLAYLIQFISLIEVQYCHCDGP